MPILYKSSSFQTYFYYIIYPILIAASIFCILGILSYGDFGLFNIIMIFIFLYTTVAATECLLRLKYIEVTENYISIATTKGRKEIQFKDIMCVYNLISFKGAYLVVWYREMKTNKLKVILVRPEKESSPSGFTSPFYLNSSEELSITKFIKEKAVKENPDYIKIYKPRWFLFSISPTFNIFS